MIRFLLCGLVVFSLSVVGYSIYFMNNIRHFSKSVTVESTLDFENLITLEQSNALDIEPLVRSIPYKMGFSYIVDPSKKYERAILNGVGDCSNFSFGLAYLLEKKEIDYSIIHFIRVDGGLIGPGHVSLQTVYEYKGKRYSGVIDLLEGGIPSKEQAFLKFEDLTHEGVKNFTITSLNDSHDQFSMYYQDDFLSNSIVGAMISEEVESYFVFLDKYYIDLGNEKIEKYVFDLAAIIFGKYPKIYVAQHSYVKLFDEHKLVVFYANLILWLMRFIPLMGIILVLTIGFKIIVGKTVSK